MRGQSGNPAGKPRGAEAAAGALLAAALLAALVIVIVGGAAGPRPAAIARQEGKTEPHVRHLAPLAFVSPRIITAIIDGTVPAGLTAMTLAKRMPYSWTEQEQPQRLDCAVQNGT